MMQEWQDVVNLSEQINSLIKEYEIRKSKDIKYVPTDKEIREAVRLYKYLLDDADAGNETSVKFKNILDEVTENTEEQIKLVGFMVETLGLYPDGSVPRELFMEKAEKWDVLDYMFEDMMRTYLRKLGKEIRR